MALRMVKTTDGTFSETFKSVLNRGDVDTSEAGKVVSEIIKRVKSEGDAALIDYTAKFDGFGLRPEEIKIDEDEIKSAVKRVDAETLSALTLAAKRIKDFHEKQIETSWRQEEEEGIVLGQLVRPLERVGVYVPGGKAAYPSSVLMNAVPARAAGVKEVIMVAPAPGGEINPHILAAARIAGVDAVFRIGGAQAIAALAYGTETVPKVDKIVGPGNIYVATAKKMVFGSVDIDMIAGPSEVLIISDGSGNPAFIAADMLAQAEHDEMAASILVTTSPGFGKAVAAELDRQLKKLGRRDIAGASIDNRGLVIIARDLDEAFDLSNRAAPEHLELALKEPEKDIDKVINAGAVFMGHFTPEALGDYIAGPNHVLPTGGSARFFSPLGAYDFIKRTSLISFSEKAFRSLGKSAERIADVEGLEAHGNTIRIRMGVKSQKSDDKYWEYK